MTNQPETSKLPWWALVVFVLIAVTVLSLSFTSPRMWSMYVPRGAKP